MTVINTREEGYKNEKGGKNLEWCRKDAMPQRGLDDGGGEHEAMEQ